MGALVAAVDDGRVGFLTIGIALGSGWAYYTLGWGGWWFWDPVENASFMPWLVGTALIHSLAVTEKRGAFQSWTVLLAIFAFSLSLLGHVPRALGRADLGARVRDRSGARRLHPRVPGDRHRRLARALRVARRQSRPGRRASTLVSRESMLLANNVLLVVALASVLLGTLYPLFLDALNLGKISVGPPYFDAVFVPLMAPAVFLMGVGPLARWKRAPLPDLGTRLRWALGVAARHRAAAAVRCSGAGRRWSPSGCFSRCWIVASTVANLRQRLVGIAATRPAARSSRANSPS